MKPSDTTLQVMWNRLLAIVEEQGQALVRAAFSPIVRECGDISAGVFDAGGRMLAQAVTGTPGHINTMAAAVRTLQKHFGNSNMKPGDIYLTNDPWIASGHLNDFLLMMPVFRNNVVVGFTSCTSHLVDLGGLGMGPEGSDIYDEGLLIPPCRLVSQGRVNELLMDIVRANSREPVANEGDIYALIACCEAGAARLSGMMAEFDLETLDALSEYIIGTSRSATMNAIRALPHGTWQSALICDGYASDIRLCAGLTISDDGILVDFAGTDGCTDKGINVPLNYATAYTVFALRCLIGPEIPNNAGSLEPFRVVAPPGCILNAQPPSPVAMRHTLGQMTPDLVYGCLSQALPDAVPAEGASCMYDLPLRHTTDAASDPGRHFALELVFNGGTGARPALDGLSATAFPSGVWGSQIETTEAAAPVLFHKRELREDSGGAGTCRGGLGQRIEISPAGEDAFLVFLSVERMRNAASGRRGGQAGASGRIRRIRPDAPDEDLPGKGTFRIGSGETLIFETPGGGGYGPAAERPRKAVLDDVTAGFISPDAARTIYGADI
ncbi:hydantoinase B/oxoprolinase family protein [uncultured Roseobacter sp.]|uniref:hydantoinase B/oxoprolinase family protein n=1 Tax=uncultured Roseobacter sp. TaxID=114847 RepID=UPI00260F3AC8|nr:hydantoinase B/oxoprolinase family protein [uncultured Roseobacter sp.]